MGDKKYEKARIIFRKAQIPLKKRITELDKELGGQK